MCTHTSTHIHTMEYYAAQKKKILSYATTWMNLENIIVK